MMDIVKHIIREGKIRKQMYDNHECTALEVEARSFNEKILALGKRITELEDEVTRLKIVEKGSEAEIAHADKRIEQLEKVRIVAFSDADLPAYLIKRIQAILEGE